MQKWHDDAKMFLQCRVMLSVDPGITLFTNRLLTQVYPKARGYTIHTTLVLDLVIGLSYILESCVTTQFTLVLFHTGT